MQLSPNGSLRSALTAITVALVGGTIAHATEPDQLQSSLLLYSESNRVKAAEAIVDLTHSLDKGHTLTGRFSFDALTGASPNGAAPSGTIQSFTRPSGQGAYVAQPGELPLDDTFKDTRFSFDGTFAQPLNRLTTVSFGGHLSFEHDYTSIGANISLTRDLNKKNTTLSVSGAFSHDLVRPVGGAPDPLTEMVATSEGEESEGDDHGEGGPGESKNLVDAVFGLTQVLDRQTLVRFNYSYSHATGYLNDPYKLLSLVEGASQGNPGEPVLYLYEARPDSRSKQAVYGELKRYISGHTVDLSYRYFWDNWGIVSHTVDFFYRLPVGGSHALQPHLRWYKQTAADFYSSFLIDGAPLPANASADYRLAPFHAITVGLQYFLPIAPNVDFNFGAEYYYQNGNLSPPVGLGALSQYELFPEMKAIMMRAGFSRGL